MPKIIQLYHYEEQQGPCALGRRGNYWQAGRVCRAALFLVFPVYYLTRFSVEYNLKNASMITGRQITVNYPISICIANCIGPFVLDGLFAEYWE